MSLQLSDVRGKPIMAPLSLDADYPWPSEADIALAKQAQLTQRIEALRAMGVPSHLLDLFAYDFDQTMSWVKVIAATMTERGL